MTSLYVDRRGVAMDVDDGALVFREDGKRIGTVPIAPLSRIFLRGSVELKANVLAKLGEASVGVVVLSGSKAMPTLLLPRPHADASRRVAQYCVLRSQESQLQFSKEIISRKLAEERGFLMFLAEQETRHQKELNIRIHEISRAIAEIESATNKQTLLGIEGRGAASYFAAFRVILPASLHFTGRNRRPPRDPFNVVLSLGYTLLHCEAVLALYAVGLDPYVGFLHAMEYNRESLACDFAESFRTKVDRFAFKAFRDRTLRPEDFSTNANGCRMGKAGRERFYPAWESEAASEIRKDLAAAASKWCGAFLQNARGENRLFA